MARSARLDVRLSVDTHALVKRAAEIEGRTLNDFVVSAVRNAAIKTIEDATVIRLSARDQLRFAEALLNPPEPNAALRRAFEHRRRLLGAEKK